MKSKISKILVNLFLLLMISSFLLACATEKIISTTEVPPQILQVTQTSSPYPTQTLKPTPNLINYQATADTITNGRVCEGAIFMGKSPNEEWVIINCDPNPPMGKTTIKVLRLDKTVSWEVSFYEMYGFSIGIENGYIGAVHWSKDGNYVYLDPSFCCVDAPENIFFNYFNNSVGVYRLNLNTGGITTTLQPLSKSLVASYAISFSSKDKYFAYTHSSDPTYIYIQNLQTGELKEIYIGTEYNASGRFAWSSDDKNLVFVATKSGWQPWDDARAENSVSFFRIDIETGILHHLFDKKDIYMLNWISDNQIGLNQLFGNETFLYDISSSSLLVVTPTPSE